VACARLIDPPERTLKRLLAAFFVFIFGILPFLLKSSELQAAYALNVRSFLARPDLFLVSRDK